MIRERTGKRGGGVGYKKRGRKRKMREGKEERKERKRKRGKEKRGERIMQWRNDGRFSFYVQNRPSPEIYYT